MERGDIAALLRSRRGSKNSPPKASAAKPDKAGGRSSASSVFRFHCPATQAVHQGAMGEAAWPARRFLFFTPGFCGAAAGAAIGEVSDQAAWPMLHGGQMRVASRSDWSAGTEGDPGTAVGTQCFRTLMVRCATSSTLFCLGFLAGTPCWA